jgi:sterol desaturase/sphingolipid hydroxylase (fatty acid hydroxylase superfamily)
LLYGLIRDGKTRMYFAVADHSWWYFGLSVALGLIGYDAWFYWYHRLLHTPWFFRHVHAIHHRASNPTAFAAYALHPIETVLGNAYFVLFVVFVPVHPLAFGAAGLAISLFAFLVHSGYEFFPSGFTQHRLFRWCGTSTHHNMHHRHVDWNYGSLFNYWDRLMGTNHPGYHATFETVKARLGALPSVFQPVADAPPHLVVRDS